MLQFTECVLHCLIDDVDQFFPSTIMLSAILHLEMVQLTSIRKI